MPPRARAQAEAPADQEGTQITQRDLLVFKDLVNNITVKPTVDWEGFARDCGFKNVETAKVRLGQIRRKYEIGRWDNTAPADGAGPSTPAKSNARAPRAPKTPRSAPKSKKTVTPADEADEDDEPIVESALGPSPGSGVKKGRPPKKAAATPRTKVEEDALLEAALENSNVTIKSAKRDANVKDEKPEPTDDRKTRNTVDLSQESDEEDIEMELVEEEDNKLGKISPSPIPTPAPSSAPTKSELKDAESKEADEPSPLPITIPAHPHEQATPQVTSTPIATAPPHPLYVSQMLVPIPGLTHIPGATGSFQVPQAPQAPPEPAPVELPVPPRPQPSSNPAPWLSDPTVRRSKVVSNLQDDSDDEFDTIGGMALTGMMSGVLPGGAASSGGSGGSLWSGPRGGYATPYYGTRLGDEQVDLTEEDNTGEIGPEFFSGGSLFGGRRGSGSGESGDRDERFI